MPDHCDVHKSEMEVIHEVRTDVKWLIRIGTRWFTFIGAALALLIPVMISFFVYLSRVESRLCVVEYKIEQVVKK